MGIKMSNFELNYFEIVEARNKLKRVENNLEYYCDTIKKQTNKLNNFSGLGINNIRSSMYHIRNKIIKESNNIQELSTFLKELEQLVTNAESNAKRAIKDEDGVVAKDWMDAVFEGLGKMGMVGGMISAIGKFGINSYEFMNEWPPDVTGIANFFSDVIGDGASTAKDILDYQHISGFLGGVREDYSSIGKALQTEGGKYWDDLIGTGKNVNTKAMWASRLTFLATIASSGISNYQEFSDGKIDEKRAIEETIMESTVGIGTGIAVSALLGATAAAIGLSGPILVAVAVGVAGVAVSFGLDWLTKTLTHGEKGFTEWVSDSILDVGESLYSGAVNCVSNIKNTVTRWGAALGF